MTRASKPSEPAAFLLGIGSADAPYVARQADLAGQYEALLAQATGDGRLGRKARLLFSRARLDTRQFAIPDVVDRAAATLYGASGPPSTGARMKVFAERAPALAEEACRRALASAGASPSDVCALVIATCTGVCAPDLDVELATRLRLPTSVERVQLVWMSCTAAFPALRTAQRAASATGGLALAVCVEICSLHVRTDREIGSLLAHGLFSDGAAATVVAAEGASSETLAALGEGATRTVTSARDALRWDLTDHGFRAHLAPELPRLIEQECPGFVRPLTDPDRKRIQSWCVHPGGPAILDAVEQSLGLEPRALETSREILRTRGNMSSATVLYVLEQELASMEAEDRGFLLGFGTGLTLEGLLFERGQRPFPSPAGRDLDACSN